MERNLAEALRLEGIQAIGDFPLITPDGQIGILSVYFDAPHAFNPDEVDLLQTLASQAAVSVANARLYASTDKALARRADQLAILEAVGRELSRCNQLSEPVRDHSGACVEIYPLPLGYADPLQFPVAPARNQGQPRLPDE